MSDFNTSMHIRMNKKQRDRFDKAAKSYGMSSSDLVRMMMDAAVDKTLRIVTTEKTITTINGVHTNVREAD